MTAEEFEAQYAERSGLTVKALWRIRTVRSCSYGEDECEDWQSISYERAAEYAKPRVKEDKG